MFDNYKSRMKKLLIALILFIPVLSFAQSTTTLPTPTTAYTPQFRYYGAANDTLKSIYVYSGGKYNRWYTATEIKKLYGNSFKQKIDSTLAADNNWTGTNTFQLLRLLPQGSNNQEIRFINDNGTYSTLAYFGSITGNNGDWVFNGRSVGTKRLNAVGSGALVTVGDDANNNVSLNAPGVVGSYTQTLQAKNGVVALVGDTTGLNGYYQSKIYAIPSKYPGANDAAKVQAAINSGLPVFLEKYYNVSAATLTISSDSTSIYAAKGKGGLYSSANSPIINLNGKSAVTIKDVTFYGSGKTSGNTLQQGLEITGTANNTKIINCEFRNLGGWAVRSHDRTNNRLTGVFVSNTTIRNCYGGYYFYNQSEYNTITGVDIDSTATAYKTFAGNNGIIGGQIVGADTAVYLGAGTNNAHSGFSRVSINHNNFNVYADGVTLGYSFENCDFYFGNHYFNNSTSIYFNGGRGGFGTYNITSNNSTNIFYNFMDIQSLPTLNVTGQKPIFFRSPFFNTAPSNVIDRMTNSYWTTEGSFGINTINPDVLNKGADKNFGIKSTVGKAYIAADGASGATIGLGYNTIPKVEYATSSTGITVTTLVTSDFYRHNVNGNFFTQLGTGFSGMVVTPTTFWDFKAATTGGYSARFLTGVQPTSRLSGGVWFDGTRLNLYNTADQSLAYLSDLTAYVPTTRTISTTTPLTGGGDLSANRTLGLGGLTGYGTANQILGMNAAATGYEYKTVTAGSGINIAQSAGAITISAQSNVVEIAGTSQTASPNTIYIPHNTALTTITIPTTTTIGSLYQVIGEGVGGWKLQLPAGYTAVGVGSFTTTSGGSLNSTDKNCTITIRLTNTNKFTVTTSQGTINPL